MLQPIKYSRADSILFCYLKMPLQQFREQEAALIHIMAHITCLSVSETFESIFLLETQINMPKGLQ